MPRVKIVHAKNFTVIQNNCIYELPSFELGVLVKMLAKRDDFNFSIDRFSKEIKETRQKTSKALKFLEDAGYLYRKQTTNKTKFGSMIYYVSDVPCLKNGIDNIEIENGFDNESSNMRNTENRSTENGMTENALTDSCMTESEAALLNTNISNTDISNTKEIKKEKPKAASVKKKKQYAEAVYMTETEYQTLCEKHSKEFADKCIEVLNNYKLSKGKFYKSDYHAILTWVEKKVSEDLSKQSYNLTASVPIQTDPQENPFARYFNGGMNENGGNHQRN